MKGKEIRMTSKEYEQRLEALEREIAALRQEAVEDGAEKPPHPKPEPKRGQIYYSIENNGKAYSHTWIGTRFDTRWDSERLAFGNVFRTRDAAEYAAEYYKVLGEMREWAGNWDDPWYLRFFDGNIAVNERVLATISIGELRFASENDALNCIKAVGKDRLIKYYFGVRDHEIPAEA